MEKVVVLSTVDLFTHRTVRACLGGVFLSGYFSWVDDLWDLDSFSKNIETTWCRGEGFFVCNFRHFQSSLNNCLLSLPAGP